MTRFGYLLITHFSVVTFTTLNLVSATPWFIWNASASVPIGLYRLQHIDKPTVGQLVAAQPPAPIAKFLAERHYLPRRVPLLKRVAAISGQTVCRTGVTVTIDGHHVGTALEYDHLGRDLPTWNGCRRLGDNEVFLMNSNRTDSLDGRYFGVTTAEAVIGEALPVWISVSDQVAVPPSNPDR